MVTDQGVREGDGGEAIDTFAWPLPGEDPSAYGCKQGPLRTYASVAREVIYVCVYVFVWHALRLG